MIRRGRPVLWVLAVCAALAPGLASAMFARMTEEQLIASSSLIVVGRLVLPPAGSGAAVIDVIRVLRGDPGTAPVVLLRVPPGAPVSSSDLAFVDGQTGLWYLRPAPGAAAGSYLADHPQRFVPQEAAADQIRALSAP